MNRVQGEIPKDSIQDSIFLHEALKTDRTDEEFKAAQIVVNSLKEIIRDYDLNALSIECFSLLSQTESTACYALSHLNDKGTVAGCEGDLPSTFTMMIVKLLIGQASFMANVASVDQEQNSAILAHCTIPLEKKVNVNFSISNSHQIQLLILFSANIFLCHLFNPAINTHSLATSFNISYLQVFP